MARPKGFTPVGKNYFKVNSKYFIFEIISKNTYLFHTNETQCGRGLYHGPVTTSDSSSTAPGNPIWDTVWGAVGELIGDAGVGAAGAIVIKTLRDKG